MIINKIWKENVVEYGLQMVLNYWTPKFTKLSVVLVKLMVWGTENTCTSRPTHPPKRPRERAMLLLFHIKI